MDVNQLRQVCTTCSLRELCLPAGLDASELAALDPLVERRVTVPRGGFLYRTKSPLQSLYALRMGFMKSSVLHEDGREQVAGFHMTGDLIGMDGISTGSHICDVIALEKSEVCEIPYGTLERLAREIPALQRHFHRILSREIVRDYGVMLLLGSMRAEERLAAFLLNLSQRFKARGYSPHEFHLRMTREEIGAYLGLKLETISRVFSRFQEEGLLDVRNKRIRILDEGALRALNRAHAYQP
ncbi:MAG TPA: fumarate/nitrate reduction transcriptional regulator Fnr [Burkholderiales bacterium]|jgi:cAMP-binding proteins - catabolite gene activator and regulatory subunit of cAMP-dependent protein kinases